MSAKTAIDLETLCAPDNDSEGTGCYISEKGIQAAPAAIEPVEGSEAAGKYQGVMYMDGVAMHIFSKKIFNEKMEPVRARFCEFDKSFKYVVPDLQTEIPDGYFEYRVHGEIIDSRRPVKTISYMTLTNRELKFFDIATNKTLSHTASNNIVALLSCNVLAFMEEKDGGAELRFVKNPLFATQTPDDLTDKFPLGIVSLRSWTPIWTGGASNADMEMSELLALTPAIEQSNGHFGAMLSEESVFVFDKNTRKVLALRQIRRRIVSDGFSKSYVSDDGTFIKVSNGSEMEIKVLLSETQAGYGNFYPWVEYVNHLYLFTDALEATEITALESDAKDLYEKVSHYGKTGWTSADTGYKEAAVGSWEDSDNDYIKTLRFHERYPAIKVFLVSSSMQHQIPYCFFNSIKDGKIRELERDEATLFSLTSIEQWYTRRVFAAWTNPGSVWFYTGNDIDTVIEAIKNRLKNEAYGTDSNWLATPDNWNAISLDGKFSNGEIYFLESPWTRVYELSQEAIIKGTAISYHTQEYLWGQRSRAFMLGSKVIAGVNPYTISNTELGIEVAKWEDRNIIGLALKILVGLGDIAPQELAPRTPSVRARWFYNGKPIALGVVIIPALVATEESDLTAEYMNAVYFSDIGSFDINTTDQHYVVPSNISDFIIGLHGEDRDLMLIGTKSIERFNIADSASDPVSFMRLEKVYDLLIDWSGINGRLDLLAKEKGAIALNGQKRAKEIFSMDSRIAPDTVWKATRLGIVECSDCYRAMDSQNRAFKIPGNAAVFSITQAADGYPLLASADGIHRCRWESAARFCVEWTYRVPRNILLSEIAIRMAQYDAEMSAQKKLIELRKDGIPIRERETSHSAVNFYKIGRGLSSRLGLTLPGYLKEVAMTDTEAGQK